MKETRCSTPDKPASSTGANDNRRQESSLLQNASESPRVAGSKQRVVVVLGMHRSGTSLLASLLTVLGVDLGRKLLGANPYNEAGHWEQEEIYQTQEALLQHLVRQWIGPAWTYPFLFEWGRLPELRPFSEQLSSIVREEISKANGTWGFKDPRTSRLLPLWKEIFAELGLEPLYLLAIREPAGVVESVTKRDHLPAARTELLWLLHNLDAVRDAGDQLRLVVDYDRWFTHPREQARAVAQALDLIWPAAEDQWLAGVRQRIRPDLRHCQTTRPRLLPFVTETYNVLKHAAASGEMPVDLRRIDEDVRRALSLCEPWASTLKELARAQSTGRSGGSSAAASSTDGLSISPAPGLQAGAPQPIAASASPAESVAELMAQGNRHYQQDALEAARRAFARATEIAGHEATAHAQLACVLVRLNRLDEARAAARRALALNPRLVEALRLLAELALHQGRNEEGAEWYRQIARFVPDDQDALLGQANCSLRRGHRVLAKLLFEQALKLDPTNAAAVAALAGLPQGQPASFPAANSVIVPPRGGQRSQADSLCPAEPLGKARIDSFMKTMAPTPLTEEIPESEAAQITVNRFAQTGDGSGNRDLGGQPAVGGINPEAAPAASADGDTRFARFRFQSPLMPRQTYQQIKQLKIDLIAGVGRAASIRDFGGLWGVHGLYLLEGAKALQCRFAEMVDVTPRPEFDAKIAELHRIMPLEVKMTQGDFRDSRLFYPMTPVEVSLLYEVLLHQDNAVEVIKQVAGKTTRCICVAQPVMKEELFALPNGAVNLQFYPEALKDQLRYSGWWEKEPVADQFTPAFWMWGQTTSHLSSIFHGYGWEPTRLETHEASEFWNYALIRFEPRARQ